MPIPLLRSLATVSSMTFLSRVFGFIRDACIARYFGAGLATDAFLVAFRLPNLLRRIFAEGAFSQSFIPLLSQLEATQDPKQTQLFINRTFTLVVVSTGLISLLGCLLAHPIIVLTAPGFLNTPSFELAVKLLRITFPYIFFIALVTFSSSILNVKKNFAWPAATPIILNLSLIVSVFIASGTQKQKVFYLAWAVFCAGVIQCLIQIPFLYRIKRLPRWDYAIRDHVVQKLAKQMLPAILGVSVTQINLIFNTLFASFLPTGSISWIYYADRLMEFPTGLLGAALTTILLPEMSDAQATQSEQRYRDSIEWGLQLTVLIAVPCSIALATIGYDVISCLFGYGRFNQHAILETSRALTGYSLGLMPMISIKLLCSAFYAKQDIKTPAKTAVGVLIITQLGNIVLIPFFQQMGLTLSISAGAILNASFLLYRLHRQNIYRPQWQSWKKLILPISAGSLGLLAYLMICTPEHTIWLTWKASYRMLRMGLLCLGGIAVYFGTISVFGLRMKDFQR